MTFVGRVRTFIREIQRRRVFRVAVFYGIAGIAVVEAADLLFPRLGLPNWTVQLVLGLMIVGFPIALLLSWALELTPEGLALDSGPAEASATIGPSAVPPEAMARPPVAPAKPVGDSRRRLLVLPFVNISPDPENEYFSDGLTDEIIADLSHIRALGVISRTSAMRLKGTDQDVRTIGRELGVQYVLEGSVRKSGEDVRISAKLIDAGTDQHLWGETFGGTIADVFDIQARVASSIASTLRIQLSPAEARELRRGRIEDPVAHESYLRARHEMWSFSWDGLEKARRHVENALAIVGDNELLLATLGHIHIWFLQTGSEPDPSHVEHASTCAEKIFELAPDSRHGTRLRGLIEFHRGDFRASRPLLQACLEQSPDDVDALAALGYISCLAGREDEGITLFERLLAIDPLTPLNHGMPGFAAVLQGRFADAVEPYRRFLEMDDGGPFSMMNWVWVLGLNRRIEEADATVAKLVERHGQTPFASVALSLYRGWRGEREEALEAISSSVQEAALHSEMFARFLAQCHALAGDRDGALRWLEKAVDFGLANYPFVSRIDPLLASVRGDPRFSALMVRVEQEWRNLPR